MHMIGVLSFVLATRLASIPTPQQSVRRYSLLIVSVASRFGELFVTGHGQDPSTRAHNAHHAAIFLSSVFLLIMGRYYLFQSRITLASSQMVVDCVALLCLGQSWWEKRDPDSERHGFAGTRCAIALIGLSLPHAFFRTIQTQQQQTTKGRNNGMPGDALAVIIKILLLIMVVTGPSIATSVVLFSAQAAAISVISCITGPSEVSYIDIYLQFDIVFITIPANISMLSTCHSGSIDLGPISRTGSTLEIHCPPHLLCHQSRMYVQPASVIGCLCGDQYVQFCLCRFISLYQYIWMGSCWPIVRLVAGVGEYPS